ncbi:MAG: ArsA family ATPase [Thermoplasmata archaeon]
MIYAFVGKGGVGKTSVSSAFAIELANSGYKTCLISMDFMPMTHYIFNNEKIEKLNIIEYTEMDAQEEWKKKYGYEVYDLVSSFFSLGPEIIDHIAKAPGIADEFILSKLLEMENNYEMIVWDTAASSSTLHLLLTEMEFYEHINRDIKFYLSIKDTLNKIRKGSVEPLEILEKWKELAKNVWNLIKNKTIFNIIETDDDLSYIQGKEIGKDLEKMDLKIYHYILNRSKNKYKESIIIPELNGNSKEIVEEIRPFLRKLLPKR